LPSRDF